MNGDAWQQALGIDPACDDFAHFGDPAREARLVDTHATKTPLVDQGIVHVSGDDAAAFLHAQFSASCRDLAPGTSLQTAWCSPKGRVLFLVRVLRLDDGAFLLALPADQVAAFSRRLAMFVLRDAVTIEECSTTHGLVVCNTADTGSPVADGLQANCAREVGDGAAGRQCWIAGTGPELAALWPTLPGDAVGLSAAGLADVRLARPRLHATLSDRFLPQELNLDAIGGVSFDKGCYPGQEIVARVRFRGTVKRRLQRLRIDGVAVPPTAGTGLLAPDGETRGTVLYGATNADGGCECVAVCELGDAPIVLESRPEIPIDTQAPPYPVAS